MTTKDLLRISLFRRLWPTKQLTMSDTDIVDYLRLEPAMKRMINRHFYKTERRYCYK